jgi:hypothetical protein
MMRQGNLGLCLDFGYLQDSQIGFPLRKPIKRIVVGTEVLWHRPVPSNGLIEHPAERDTIDHSGMDAESNDPARALIHDHQDPSGSATWLIRTGTDRALRVLAISSGLEDSLP